MSPSEFVQTITSTIVNRFQSNLTTLSSITCRCVIRNICSCRPQVKVLLKVSFERPMNMNQHNCSPHVDMSFETSVLMHPKSRSQLDHKSIHQARHVVPGQLSGFVLTLENLTKGHFVKGFILFHFRYGTETLWNVCKC